MCKKFTAIKNKTFHALVINMKKKKKKTLRCANQLNCWFDVNVINSQ